VAGLGGVPHAQATPPITPSGLNTQVNLSATPPAGKVQYDITGGTRPGGGTNLFHSFGDFNVPTNNIANFLNDSGLATSNILGRVTGGNLSNIFGTIQTTGFGAANLFLMNPAGFLFGPNATVNVGGMMTFTTADYLRLADNVRFNAIPDVAADALLSAAPVVAFGFLGSNPGAITVQGSQFTVTLGTGISLVGGNITLQSGTLDDGAVKPARISAPGGQINLASVASPGEVSAVDFMPSSGMTMGSINLSQGATLDVSGNAAGTVRIRGGQLIIADATISADTENANGAPTAVDIQVTGDLSISDTRGVPAITARTTGDGNAGAIQINAANLTATSTFSSPNPFISVPPFALIETHTSGSGKGGDVNITAT
jgi:filamentous hemagglutinin family protein